MAPTPESASFLAKKPTVPPTFDGVDYDDTKRLKQAQDAIIREQWVRSMMARLVREEMGKCYYREGVNHLEKCGPLRGMLPDFVTIALPLRHEREDRMRGARGGRLDRNMGYWVDELVYQSGANCSRTILRAVEGGQDQRIPVRAAELHT